MAKRFPASLVWEADELLRLDPGCREPPYYDESGPRETQEKTGSRAYPVLTRTTWQAQSSFVSLLRFQW